MNTGSESSILNLVVILYILSKMCIFFILQCNFSLTSISLSFLPVQRYWHTIMNVENNPCIVGVSPLCQCFVCNLCFSLLQRATAVSSSVFSKCISVAFSASGSTLYQLITAHFPLKALLWAAGPAKQRGHFLHHTGRKACTCLSQLKSIRLWAAAYSAHHTSPTIQ